MAYSARISFSCYVIIENRNICKPKIYTAVLLNALELIFCHDKGFIRISSTCLGFIMACCLKNAL